MKNRRKFYIDGKWVEPLALGPIGGSSVGDMDRVVLAARHAFGTEESGMVLRQESIGVNGMITPRY